MDTIGRLEECVDEGKEYAEWIGQEGFIILMTMAPIPQILLVEGDLIYITFDPLQSEKIILFQDLLPVTCYIWIGAEWLEVEPMLARMVYCKGSIFRH